MTGYSVSFFPGSSGRFIANIVYSLLNNLEADIIYDDVNSSHGTTLYKSNIDFDKIPDVEYQSKSNYLQLFRYLHFLPCDYVPVLPTHSYPVTEDLDANKNKDTFKMIVIGLTKNDLLEVNTNHIVKNIWPLLDKLKTVGFNGLSKVDESYMNDTIKSLGEYKVNFLKLDRHDTIEQYVRLASIKQLNTSYIRFIEPVIDPKYLAKTLVLQYNDLFVKTVTGYKGLDILSSWFGILPSESLLRTYTKYVEGRNLLVDKFEFLTDRRDL